MPPAKPTKEQSQDALKAFMEATAVKAPTLLDRSTLEDWLTCPHMASQKQSGGINDSSAIAVAGEEAHVALSRATTAFIQEGVNVPAPGWISQEAEMELIGSRPDVQPEAIAAAKRSLWSWGRFLWSIRPSNIMRYDGGEGTHSGQLSWDLEGLNARITSEIDLLYAGPGSPEILYEVDYKSGQKWVRETDVKQAFQFNLHWWLIAHNYPETKALRVSVWNTRRNRRTYSVQFERDDLPAIAARIHAAAGNWHRFSGIPPAKADAYPLIEKCAYCPAKLVCKLGFRPETTPTPEESVDRLAVLKEVEKELKKIASKHVDDTGQEITTLAGNAFGLGKPRATKPTKSLYKAPNQESSDDDGDEDDTDGGAD